MKRPNRGREAALIVRPGLVPARSARARSAPLAFPIDHRRAGKCEHVQIVQVVADGENVGGGPSASPDPSSQRGALGAAGAVDVDEREVAMLVS